MDTYCALPGIPDDPMMPPVMIADRRGMPEHADEHGYLIAANAMVALMDLAVRATMDGVTMVAS